MRNIISAKYSKYLFSLMMFTVVIFASSCSEKTIQVENPSQLKTAVLANLVKKLNPKDTLFIVTSRLIGICGNDERFSAINQAKEKLKQFKLFKEDTYMVNENEEEINNYK